MPHNQRPRSESALPPTDATDSMSTAVLRWTSREAAEMNSPTWSDGPLAGRRETWGNLEIHDSRRRRAPHPFRRLSTSASVRDDPPMSYSRILIHTMLICARRRAWLEPDLQQQLYPWLGGILRPLNAVLLATNGVPDHAHLLLSVPASRSMAEIMRELKAKSSRWIHHEWSRPDFSWQREYAAFSVAPSTRAHVERYIANQAEHHRKVNLRDEMLALLKAHGLSPSPHDPWLAQ